MVPDDQRYPDLRPEDLDVLQRAVTAHVTWESTADGVTYSIWAPNGADVEVTAHCRRLTAAGLIEPADVVTRDGGFVHPTTAFSAALHPGRRPPHPAGSAARPEPPAPTLRLIGGAPPRRPWRRRPHPAG